MAGAIVLSPTGTASREAVMDRPGKVANPARGQSAEQRKLFPPLFPLFTPENWVSRGRFGRPVSR